MPAPTWTTEVDYCPLTGDRPGVDATGVPAGRVRMAPIRYLPPGTTDADAERERARAGADHWSRRPNGSVVLWMDLR